MKHWTRDTLDSLVENGTSPYDKVGKYEFLAVEELPSVVDIFNKPINVEFKFNSHGILSREKGNMDILKDMIHRNVEVTGNTDKKATNTCGICSARFTCKRRRGQSKFKWGFCFTVFKGVSRLVDYLCDTYLGESSDKLIGYQIQFVNCSSTNCICFGSLPLIYFAQLLFAT